MIYTVPVLLHTHARVSGYSLIYTVVETYVDNNRKAVSISRACWQKTARE